MTASPGINSLEALPDLRFCCDHTDAALTSRFLNRVEGAGVSNIFNPSFYQGSGVSVFSFRAIPDGSRELVSFVSVEDQSGRTLQRISPLSYPGIDAPRLIDPKVFTIGEEVYLTFNSGWVPSRGNDIFVMKVYPTMGEPKRLVYRERLEQERNWALFSDGSEVYAIYRIAPLVILRLESESENTWLMAECFRGNTSGLPEDLTLGTQPSGYGGRHYFMAHRKYLLQRKKLYLGRLCALDPASRVITAGVSWLAHSPESLSGSPVKHNTNLYSCTYFSGLQATASGIQLGYGINDVDFGFSTYAHGELLE